MSEQEGAPHDEALGGEPFEDAGVAPIDVVDERPATPAPARELTRLALAPPEKEKIKSGESEQVFAAVQKLQRPNADPDELNNVGCAWAFLAYMEARVDYWPRALEALEASSGHAKASEAQKRRAKDNVGRVNAARQEAGFD